MVLGEAHDGRCRPCSSLVTQDRAERLQLICSRISASPTLSATPKRQSEPSYSDGRVWISLICSTAVPIAEASVHHVRVDGARQDARCRFRVHIRGMFARTKVSHHIQRLLEGSVFLSGPKGARWVLVEAGEAVRKRSVKVRALVGHLG